MPPLPVDLLVPMTGVVAGLILFAALLQLGVRIVRWLGLPNDVPEGPHFEPPPPPSRDVLDHAEAGRIAARQARLRQLFARARAATQAAQHCAELAAQDYRAVDGAPDPAIARAELATLAATARTAATAADEAVHGDAEAAAEAIEAQAVIATGALAAAQALAVRYPSGRERRLRLMLVVLAVMVLWSVLMYALLPALRR